MAPEETIEGELIFMPTEVTYFQKFTPVYFRCFIKVPHSSSHNNVFHLKLN
jgi:hypothetical protein